MQVGIKFIIGFWHQVILDLQLADYSRTNDAGSEIMAPENPGPCYSSRAFAIAHLVMYDAYVGVTEEGATYLEYNQADLPKNNKQISGAGTVKLAFHLFPEISFARRGM